MFPYTLRPGSLLTIFRKTLLCQSLEPTDAPGTKASHLLARNEFGKPPRSILIPVILLEERQRLFSCTWPYNIKSSLCRVIMIAHFIFISSRGLVIMLQSTRGYIMDSIPQLNWPFSWWTDFLFLRAAKNLIAQIASSRMKVYGTFASVNTERPAGV